MPIAGSAVSAWHRVLVAAAVATLAIPLTFKGPGDLGQAWFAASAILHHADPYRLVGPGGSYVYQHDLNLFYPLTAAVTILPLGFLREAEAAVVFSWISAFLFTYSITSKGWERLPILLSLPVLSAAHQPQWSLLLAAGFGLPLVAWTFAAKPTIGGALLLATGSQRTFTIAVVGGAVLLGVSLLFVPSWPIEWLAYLRTQTYLKANTYMSSPALRPAGFVTLAALFRWRRPEARLIIALACAPQTNAWYDAAVLMLVASTFRESLILAAASMAPMVYELAFIFRDGGLDLYPRTTFELLGAVYIPAILIVLRRPNEGPLPAWFEILRRLARRRASLPAPS